MNRLFSSLFILIVLTGFFKQSVADNTSIDTTNSYRFVESLKPFLYSRQDSIRPLLDSVIKVLEVKGNSRALGNAYLYLGNLFFNDPRHNNEVFANLNKAIKVSKALNDNKLYNNALFGLGVFYANKGNYDSANYYYKKVYRKSLSEHDSTLIPSVLLNTASIQVAKNNYAAAVKTLFEAEPYFIRAKNNFRLTLLYNLLATSFQKTKRYKSSLKYYRLALQHDSLTNKINYTPLIIANIGQLYFEQGNTDSALYYFNQAREMISFTNQPVFFNNVMINIANIYLEIKQYRLALKMYNKIYNEDTNNLTYFQRTAITINLGNVYYYLGKYDSAIYFAHQGTLLAKKYSLLEYERNAHSILFSVDSAQGNWIRAIAELKTVQIINDSLINEQSLESIDNMRISNELEKQTVKNKFLKQENILNNKLLKKRNYIILLETIALIIIIVLLILLITSRKKIKKLHFRLQKINNEVNIKNQELSQANNELRQMNVSKTKFFSIISHDLRSPFNSIMGMIELLNSSDYDFTEEEKTKMIFTVGKSVNNVFRLLENLLEWSHLQNESIKPDFQHVDLNKICKKSFELYELNSNRKNIKLEYKVQEDLFCEVDERITSNVVNNLIDNALKFTPEGGVITLLGEKHDDHVEICVVDTGIGIPKDKIENIFALDNEYLCKGTNNEKGSGLGLTLCKEYVELMGGSISVESTQGEGSRFCITLAASR